MIISKELLSEVIELDTEEVGYWDTCKATITYWYKGDSIGENINIYELAHKCKEWAVKSHREDKSINDGNHFYVNHIDSSHIGLFEHYQCCISYRGLDKDGDWSDVEKCFSSKDITEPEAIFKACQWILDNKD